MADDIFGQSWRSSYCICNQGCLDFDEWFFIPHSSSLLSLAGNFWWCQWWKATKNGLCTCSWEPQSSSSSYSLAGCELQGSISSVHMLTAELQGSLQFLQAAWMSLGFLLGQQSHDPSHQDCEWLHQWLAGRDNRWEKAVESSRSLARSKNIRCKCYWPYLCVTDGARLQRHCWNVGIIICAHHFLAQPGAKPKLWQIAMQSFANVMAFKRLPEKMNPSFLTVTMHA